MTETEVALAVRALAANSGAPTAERDEVDGADVVDASEGWVRDQVPSRRFPYLAVLGGVAGVGLVVLLVISVLTVSEDSRRPAVEMQHAPSTSAAPTRAVTPASTSATVPAMPAPQTVAPVPSEVPTPQDQPPVQVMAPQAPLSAETMRPEPPPPPPLQMFPRLRRWFPNMFPEG
jgi:type IV secretory pathway VirB10-like protein